MNLKNIDRQKMAGIAGIRKTTFRQKDFCEFMCLLDRIGYFNQDESDFVFQKIEEQFEHLKFLDSVYGPERKLQQQKIREGIIAWKKELMTTERDFVIESRLRYLKPIIDESKEKLRLLKIDYEKAKDYFSKNEKDRWVKDLIFEGIEKEYQSTDKLLTTLTDEFVYLERKKNKNEITERDIQQAREVWVGDLIEVKRKIGNRSMAVCPFHDDHHPSMTIYEAGKGFHCFACGTGGDSIEFVMKLQNIDFLSAVRFLLRK